MAAPSPTPLSSGNCRKNGPSWLPSAMVGNKTLILRLVALAALLVLTIVALVVSVQMAHQTAPGTDLPCYVVLGLAVSATSAAVTLPVIGLQIARPTCAPFFVWLEIVWTSLLGSAWFALAIVLSVDQEQDTSLTSFVDRPTLAARFTALQDAAFLAWALLWAWSLWVTILAIRAWRSGQSRVWSCPTSQQVKFLEIKPVSSLLDSKAAEARRDSVDSEMFTASNPR